MMAHFTKRQSRRRCTSEVRDEEFSFGHVEHQVPLNHWNRDVKETVVYMSLQSRRNLCAQDVNPGVISIWMVFEVTGCDCQVREHEDSLGWSLWWVLCCPVRFPYRTESLLPLRCWLTALAISPLQEFPLAEESCLAQSLALLEKSVHLHLNSRKLRKVIPASQVLMRLSECFFEIVSQFKFSLWSILLPSLPFFILSIL